VNTRCPDVSGVAFAGKRGARTRACRVENPLQGFSRETFSTPVIKEVPLPMWSHVLVAFGLCIGFLNLLTPVLTEKLDRMHGWAVSLRSPAESFGMLRMRWKFRHAPPLVHRTLPLRTDLERVDEFICENNRDYSGLFKK
jgi:hypothetical protein